MLKKMDMANQMVHFCCFTWSSNQTTTCVGVEPKTYPIIVEGQSDALPCRVVAAGYSYSHPRLTILSGYLKDEAVGCERALAEIDVRVVANHMSLYSAHEQEPTTPG
jgi:hypothetical protein